MPRRHKFKCIKPNCDEEWLLASRRRLQYCEKHHYLALGLYNKYKEATEQATTNFKNEDIILAIKLRSQYDTEFVGGDDGAHVAYIELLRDLLKFSINKRKKLYNYLIKQFERKYF